MGGRGRVRISARLANCRPPQKGLNFVIMELDIPPAAQRILQYMSGTGAMHKVIISTKTDTPSRPLTSQLKARRRFGCAPSYTHLPSRPELSFRRQLKNLLFTCFVLTLIGCSSKSTTAIGGPYYLDSSTSFGSLFGPGGFEVHLSYRQNGKTVLISKHPGGYGATIYDNFSWRVYGSNLVYVEHDRGSYSTFRLVVYSERNGNVTIDPDYRYWKIIANDQGITCHRFTKAGGCEDDPSPKFFSAEYLRGL
jgi:hypothetical protein